MKKKIVIEVIIDCPHMNESGECEEFPEKSVVFCPKRDCTRTTSLADLLACVRGNLAPDDASVQIGWHAFLEGEMEE